MRTMKKRKNYLWRVYFKETKKELIPYPISARTKNEAKIIALVSINLDKNEYFDSVYVEFIQKGLCNRKEISI